MPKARMRVSHKPVEVALTLPYTQRVSTQELRQAIFSSYQRWLEADHIPDEVRSASYTVRRTTVGKLAALLIDYRFDNSI